VGGIDTVSVDLSQDPIVNAIHGGIRRGIEVTIENGCLGSAVILILSAIDTMAYLSMPEAQEDVARADFLSWAKRYIRFPGREQLDGADLYGARCSMLHTYGAQSKMSRDGSCRVILWMDHAEPPILSNSKIPGYVMVAVTGLCDSLFQGMDRFFVDIFREPQSKQAALVNQRFNKLVHEMSTQEVMRATDGEPSPGPAKGGRSVKRRLTETKLG